jgi:hypothetical protein
MSHYKKWSQEDKQELKTLTTKAEVKKYAKEKGRTISAVCNAIRRYTGNEIPQGITAKPVTRSKTSTLVFNNYKSVIIENGSILIEF